MARNKPKSTPTELTNPEGLAREGFDTEMQAWTEDMANSCVAPALPAQENPEGARTDDEEPTKVKIPNPYPFRSDAQTGVTMLEDRQLRRMQLKFDMKPSDEVRLALREAGFRWKSQHQMWEIAIDKEQSWTARAKADKVFQQVTGMIRQELNISHEVA
jgi:hypothetical protein